MICRQDILFEKLFKKSINSAVHWMDASPCALHCMSKEEMKVKYLHLLVIHVLWMIQLLFFFFFFPALESTWRCWNWDISPERAAQYFCGAWKAVMAEQKAYFSMPNQSWPLPNAWRSGRSPFFPMTLRQHASLWYPLKWSNSLHCIGK